jgi:membrane-associated phospholipid phosphatase
MSTSPPHLSTPRADPTAGREVRLLAAVSDATAGLPAVVGAARGLSHLGEHALGWIAAGAVGAAVDAPRRALWGQAVLGAVGAHGASVVLKRVVRRRRPDHRSVRVRVGTPSRLSFPSSHATSTTAAALLLGDAVGAPAGLLPAVLVPPMLASRLVLGVHYPTDVLAGAGLGWASAAGVRAARRRGLLGGDPR